MEQLIEQIITAVTGFVGSAGYLGVFLLMALEACCMPIPSEVVLVSAGYLVAEGKFSLAGAMLSAFAGALTGASFVYSVARFGGRPLVLRFGRYLLLTEKRLNSAEGWFRRHGAKAVFLCRLVSGVRAIVSLPAGLCHMPYPKFLIYTALGSGAWVVTGTLFGMFVGKEWKKLSDIGHIVMVVAVVLVGAAMVWHHFRGHKEPTEESRESGVAKPAPQAAMAVEDLAIESPESKAPLGLESGAGE